MQPLLYIIMIQLLHWFSSLQKYLVEFNQIVGSMAEKEVGLFAVSAETREPVSKMMRDQKLGFLVSACK